MSEQERLLVMDGVKVVSDIQVSGKVRVKLGENWIVDPNAVKSEPKPTEVRYTVSPDEVPHSERYCTNCKNEQSSMTGEPCKTCIARNLLDMNERCTLWEPKPFKLVPVETGLDDRKRQKLWSWWGEINGYHFCVVDVNEDRYVILNSQGSIGSYSALITGPFLGMSNPGCSLDGTPLEGGVWQSDCDHSSGLLFRIDDNDHTGQYPISAVCVSERNTPLSSVSSIDFWLAHYEFLRMSQLDPPKPEVKPLSETIAVGDVVKDTQNFGLLHEFIGIDGGEVKHFRRQDGKIATVSNHRLNTTWTLVSRAADKPLHERVRLGSVVRGKHSDSSHRIKLINGIFDEHVKLYPGGHRVTFDNLDANYELISL